jgi:signal transduction histidine kinase
VIATGLAGSMLIPAADSPLQWVTRTTRAWGTVYLCVAVLAEGRGRGIRQPLLTGLAQVGWQRASALARLDRRTFLAWGLRYGSAVAAVAAGFLVRLALTAWSGPGLPPYLTYYPAVMTVALLAGFGPGLLASVLAGLTAVTWGLDPIGPLVIGASVNRLGLVIFLGMGLCTSVVAEVYRRARNKAAAYDSEVARRESETKYHFLFNNITEEVHFWQLVRFEDGRIQTWRLVDANPPTLKTWGKTADEIRGRTTDEIFGPGATAHYLPVVEKIMREGVPHSFEDYFPNLGKHFKFTSVPLGDYFITTGTDITDIKKIQDDLREADRRKDDFLAMLSHELRNPLAAINNGIYLLDHGVPGSEPARRAQTVIGRQMKQLSRLVDDLLDMTRISRNKIQLQFERMDLVQVARRAIEDHRGPLEANGLRLDFAAPIEAVWVLADAARVTQMLGNLLLNAGKFTDPGGAVTLEIQARGAEAAVIVTDTGIGMDEAMLSRLFQPFAQADRSLDRSRGGLGLGLALTKGMAELHGGALIASSPGLGQGSRFLLTLPAAPPQARGAESPVSARPARRHRVLVIEDNLDAALTLKLLLELSGHEVTTAHTGGEGIAQAKAQRPEVILCDIGLPDTDGYRVARTLREEPEWQPSCLVAMTGYGQPEDKRRALEAGFDHHLTKPADPEALTRLLAF